MLPRSFCDTLGLRPSPPPLAQLPPLPCKGEGARGEGETAIRLLTPARNAPYPPSTTKGAGGSCARQAVFTGASGALRKAVIMLPRQGLPTLGAWPPRG